jgi:hypothetical protein
MQDINYQQQPFAKIKLSNGIRTVAPGSNASTIWGTGQPLGDSLPSRDITEHRNHEIEFYPQKPPVSSEHNFMKSQEQFTGSRKYHVVSLGNDSQPQRFGDPKHVLSLKSPGKQLEETRYDQFGGGQLSPGASKRFEFTDTKDSTATLGKSTVQQSTKYQILYSMSQTVTRA